MDFLLFTSYFLLSAPHCSLSTITPEPHSAKRTRHAGVAERVGGLATRLWTLDPLVIATKKLKIRKNFREPHAYPNKLSKSFCVPTQNQ